MATPKNKFLKALQLIVSLVALLVIVVLFFYAKNQIEGKYQALHIKIPRNETEFKQFSNEIVSSVVQSATEGGIKKVLGESAEFFEESEIAAPARSIRDDAKNTVDDLLSRLKSLPAEELKVIKQKIYETWIKPE